MPRRHEEPVRHRVRPPHERRHDVRAPGAVRDEAFAAAHRTILVYTREGTVELEVFAADVLDANREGVRTDFAGAAELQGYIDERLERCEVVLDHPEDVGRVWAFATCSYQTANSRTVVLAREVG